MSGTVTLNHTTVTNNTAVIAGGGIASGTFGPTDRPAHVEQQPSGRQHQPGTGMGDGIGAGIVNLQGTATLNSSEVDHNTAGGFAGGGIANGNYNGTPGPTSTLTLNKSEVNDNTAPIAGGGGIQNLAGSVTLNSSQVMATLPSTAAASRG